MSWIAHWRQFSRVNTSRDRLELPYHGVGTNQDSEEDQPGELDQNQFEKFEMDSSSASGSKWKLVQRNGCGSVEVMPMLLQPAERLKFGCNKNTELFELVTRSQKDISESPAEKAVQSQGPAPSASPANLGAVVDPCPVFLSDKAVLSSSVQKDRDLEVAPRECSLIHESGMSSFRAIQACEDKSCPLALRNATGRGLDIAAEEPDVRLPDLANQSHQMVKASIKDFLFDANIDKDELFESTSGPLMIPTIPMPIKMNLYEDKSRLASSRATHNEQLTCNHSAYCRNSHCQKGSCSPLPYTEKRVSMVERTSKQFIHPVFGGFLSSTFIERKGKIIQSCSELEFSGPIKGSQRSSKFLVMPDRINLDAIPSCSICDAGTLRISTAVDKVERVPREPSKFSKTTHSFLLTKQCNMSVPREDQLARILLSDAENYQNAFLKMTDFCSLSYLHDEKDIRTKLFAKSSRTNPLNVDFYGHRFRLSGEVESGSPSNSARDSSPKPRDNNEICAQASGSAACFGQPHAILVSKENFANTSSSTAGQNHLDLNTILTLNSSEGLSTDMINKDSREAETAYELLQKITPLEKETKFGHMDTNVSMRDGDLRSCLDVNGPNEKKGMCALKARNSSAETPYLPVCEPSGFSDLASGQSIGWVKRLKRNDSEAFGTKTSVLGDTFPEHKRTKLLNKAGGHSRFFASSDSISSPWIKKQRQDFAEGVTTPRQGKSAAELLKESRLILSSPWLQRLRPRESQAKKTGPAELTGEPASCPKLALKMQSKESPTSLGAMALLGKVMSNFSKCGLSKNGTSMVWKAEELKEECHPKRL
ncbi:uncharacterized protein LOC116264614 [Nymphaea colorata]|nr:uncharacterized protein LOC116264614 [Nymphaea colorata]XP_031500795.1 uncharacterized protein LOC116264614 [Nymphaea colorata]XP_031500796.1 uncharacterized protein LOC116264614 [Nymphaea colorata]